jgi:hypothetical protein
MGNDANGIVACVKLKFFHLEGGGLNHQRDYQYVFLETIQLSAWFNILRSRVTLCGRHSAIRL